MNTTNLYQQDMLVTKAHKSKMKNQTPKVLWFTGLSGAGKSTLANALEVELYHLGYHTHILDGDNVRQGLNKDLGFTDADRVENIRRMAEVAKLMNEAGIIVITAFISPFASERKMARQLIGENQFIEIFVDVPLQIAEARDPKGLYKKARLGEIKNFTGIDSVYEVPNDPDLHIKTDQLSIPECVKTIIKHMKLSGFRPDTC
ncbi:bifunctional enzyme CysN/CysC [Allopseudospirillum japonicum]|uniref:Adenylyl-sulfate kinase n=1 Tax=Allopseudospirillum japonicum TaxID=64971 RepID=A0A1H6UF68_9GAMM|nr:adenylyl-sulfate kinase [Allopseudospirillum japonicum]SEI86785.1 bifunctional enzyme CysN/CysC [Allopseudospirillum japonicum]